MTRIVRMESGPAPVLSICVPSHDWSDPRHLEVTEAICQHTRVEWELVVVDCQGELRFYTDPQNEAVAAARAPYVVAMNDDVILSAGWDQALLEPLRDGAWCATPDQTHAADGPQVFAPYCMAWIKRAWDRLGGLDSRFKWWCSDIDLARRLHDDGHYPVRVQMPVSIRHACGQTATGLHQAALNERALQDLDEFRKKWGVEAEQEKVRLAVLCGANQDPRLEHLRAS